MTALSPDLVPGWDLISIWKQMGWFARTVVITLCCMAANVAGVMTLGILRYRAARRATRKFLREASAPLRDHDLVQALMVSKRHPDSPVATMTICGVEAFSGAIESPWNDAALEIASNAVERCRGRMRAEVAAGLSSLWSIGAVAPFIGIAGTLVAILNAVDAMFGPPCGGCCAGGISETLITTALGLLVAIPALAGFSYLHRLRERFDAETVKASSELLTYIRGFPIQAFAQREGAELVAPTSESHNDSPHWEIPYDRQPFVLGPVWIFGSLFMGMVAFRIVRGLFDSVLR